MARAKLTHEYVGGNTAWGLKKGTRCRVTGSEKSPLGERLVHITDGPGNHWKVPKSKVKRTDR